MKNPLTPAGIQSASFRSVAQHLNHCAIAATPSLTAYLILEKVLNKQYYAAERNRTLHAWESDTATGKLFLRNLLQGTGSENRTIRNYRIKDRTVYSLRCHTNLHYTPANSFLLRYCFIATACPSLLFQANTRTKVSHQIWLFMNALLVWGPIKFSLKINNYAYQKGR